MADASTGNINLQTLNAILLQGVQAQNLIATNIAKAFPTYGSSITWDPPSVNSGAQTTTTVTVANAVIGMPVLAAFSQDLQGLSLTGYVSAVNTVTVVLSNSTGGTINLSSGILTVKVFGA